MHVPALLSERTQGLTFSVLGTDFSPGFHSHFDSYEKMYPKSFLTVVSGCSIFHVNDPKDNMYLCRVVF